MVEKSLTGSGAWYSNIWLVLGGGAADPSPPAPGDTAYLETQTVTISAADVTTHGSLDGITVHFAGSGGGQATLDVTGETFGSGFVLDNNAGSGGGRLVARGATVNFGTIAALNGAVSGTMTLDIQGVGGTASFTNSGTIQASGGSLVVSGGTLVNTGAGSIVANSGGTLAISSAVTGSGTIHIANRGVAAFGSVANTQTLAFDSNLGILQLTDPGNFHGTVTGLTGRDVIDLVGIAADLTSYDAGTGVLTVTNAGTTVASFVLTGGQVLNTVTDGAGGTVLTTKLPGTRSELDSALINGVPGGAALNWISTPSVAPVVTYSFDAGSNWTGPEQAAFLRGLGFWAGIADISFQAAATGVTGELSFLRASNGGAQTSITASAGRVLSAVVGIDTSVDAFANITATGTADLVNGSGFGGYAWMTVLHEIGHALGLSHPGDYDVTANLATDQTYYLDSSQYTVMSYFAGVETNALWSVSGYNGTELNPQTPMLADISAIQSIYGANTTTLAGGQVFGFNSSFASGSVWQAYDFTLNPQPVVTIWDGGAGNTLDLSGFSTASSVDLQAGGYSSVAGLTNNLAIAYGTVIETALGGAGDDRFVASGLGNVIDGGTGTDSVVFAQAMAQYGLVRNGGTVTVTRAGTIDTLRNVESLVFTDQTVAANSIACFARGTRIRTERGDVPVEALRPGEDWAITASGHAARIAWTGWRRVALRGHARPWDVDPVRVCAGAVAPGLPQRDLLLSPDHALFLDGVLIPVRYLINDATIVQQRHWREVDYFHVELDQHDLLLAEGLPAESYLDTGNRHAFTGAGAVQIQAVLAPASWAADGCAALVTDGPALAQARARLHARAEICGWRVDDDPSLHVLADGRAIRPRRRGALLDFDLPAARCLLLASRAAAPADTDAASADRRCLGVAVRLLAADGRELRRAGPGWHDAEPGWCWTDGAATLDVRGAATLTVGLAATCRFWRRDDAAAASA